MIVRNVTEGMAIALDAIRSNQLRSALTILGVVMGIMTVTGMSSIVAGLNASMAKQIEGFGSGVLFVRPFGPGENLSAEERRRRKGLNEAEVAAIAARFIFPAVSLEGRQLWLLRSSPLDQRALLWSKYWIGAVPLLLLALVITIATNAMLQASAFMMAVSIGTTLCFTVAASAMALAMGVYYPQFETENAAQIPTSFGGLLFMMASVTLLGSIIMVEATPVAAQ